MNTTPEPTPELRVVQPPIDTETLTANILAIIASEGNEPESVVAGKIVRLLVDNGIVMHGVPPVQQVLADARQYSDELVLTKLVIRFFRVMILGAVIIPETPAAMDWLRDYIDGTHKVHGPLGKPMIWPGRLPQICDLLRGWGFQPTPTNPQYVSLRPGGKMMPLPEFLDPQAPDPHSVEPMDERSDAIAAALGKLLDAKVGRPGIMAFDRATVLRAMKVAYESGQFNCEHRQVDLNGTVQ